MKFTLFSFNVSQDQKKQGPIEVFWKTSCWSKFVDICQILGIIVGLLALYFSYKANVAAEKANIAAERSYLLATEIFKLDSQEHVYISFNGQSVTIQNIGKYPIKNIEGICRLVYKGNEELSRQVPFSSKPILRPGEQNFGWSLPMEDFKKFQTGMLWIIVVFNKPEGENAKAFFCSLGQWGMKEVEPGKMDQLGENDQKFVMAQFKEMQATFTASN